MNKKKIIALSLAGALILGIGMYGTYSYFTNISEKSETMIITLGNVKVDSDTNSTVWTYNPSNQDDYNDRLNDTNSKDEDSELHKGQKIDFGKRSRGDEKIKNLRPGDIFEKIINVTNIGTLTENIKIKNEGYLKTNETNKIKQVNEINPHKSSTNKNIPLEMSVIKLNNNSVKQKSSNNSVKQKSSNNSVKQKSSNEVVNKYMDIDITRLNEYVIPNVKPGESIQCKVRFGVPDITDNKFNKTEANKTNYSVNVGLKVTATQNNNPGWTSKVSK